MKARGLLIGALVLLLSACGVDSGRRAQAPSAGLSALRTRAAPEQCDAKDLLWLVGRPRTAIPVALDLSRRRVSCTTCPDPGDAKPDRTNILFDAQTGLVRSVTCG